MNKMSRGRRTRPAGRDGSVGLEGASERLLGLGGESWAPRRRELRSIVKAACSVCSVAAVVGFAPGASAQEVEDPDDQYGAGASAGVGTDTGVSAGAGTTADTERRDHDESRRFGDMGHVVISAERMFGVGFAWESVDVGTDDDATSSSFNLSVLSNPLGNVASTYSFPRVGIDFFIAENLSIGAALGFAYTSFDVDDEIAGFAPADDLTSFLAAPRIGYSFMFADGIGIWPRVGVTWLWASTSGGTVDQTANRFALTFEAPFVISPTDNVAFLIGPTFDLGLSGTNTVETDAGDVDTDITATELGIQFGLLTYF